MTRQQHETPDDFHKTVNEVAAIFYKILGKKTKHMTEQERWLVCGRAVNTIFSNFYGMSLAAKEEQQASTEERR